MKHEDAPYEDCAQILNFEMFYSAVLLLPVQPRTYHINEPSSCDLCAFG